MAKDEAAGSEALGCSCQRSGTLWEVSSKGVDLDIRKVSMTLRFRGSSSKV